MERGKSPPCRLFLLASPNPDSCNVGNATINLPTMPRDGFSRQKKNNELRIFYENGFTMSQNCVFFCRMIGEPARGIRSPVLEQQISVGWFTLVYTSQQMPLNQTHTIYPQNKTSQISLDSPIIELDIYNKMNMLFPVSS